MSKVAENRTSGGRRIAIAGAGLVGLSCAFELYRRGHDVTLFDPAGPARSTSWAAAGMIAPAYEVMLHGGGADTPLARLCFESAMLWAGYSQALQHESGQPVGYTPSATLALARDNAELQKLTALKQALETAGHVADWRDVSMLRESAGLSGSVQAVLELPEDHQVDNRRLIHALRSLAGRAGFRIVQADVARRADIERLAGKDDLDAVIWARGVNEAGVDKAVKGQALALHPVPGLPDQVLRFGSGYIVPKPDRVVIGATSEEVYAHEGVTDEATRTLLAGAQEVLPALSKAEIMEVWTGLRPKRGHGVPLIGPVAEDEYVAAAHHRNGVLLAPATATRLADMIEGRPPAPDADAFAPPGRIGATA